jgi:type 1 glutamine amidotransferase
VLVLAGPSSHPPGTHEVQAGARVVGHCLNQLGVEAQVGEAWPDDPAALATVRGLVFIGDVFPPMRWKDSPRILAEIGALMKRGGGLACLHYATGLRKEDVGPNGEHPLMDWLGGYFSTGGATHHRSVAKVFSNVTFTSAAPKHVISRGWKPFTVDDEPYYNNYLGPRATVLLHADLPPEAPKKEAVAWCTERADGGRGFAAVIPHFFRNWQNEDLRRFVLNGVVWSHGGKVPKGGVKTALPGLEEFKPESVEPRLRRK